MALGYLQRENLILESYWLVHKEKACVASRKHLKRRSKEKFWKIDSGFYKISCKPPQENEDFTKRYYILKGSTAMTNSDLQ